MTFHNHTVHFFIPEKPNFQELLKYEVDRDWKKMDYGERWTLQTYLRLEKAGHPVSISSSLPDSGILVFHASHIKFIKAKLSFYKHRKLVFVATRGDKKEVPLADIELLQNRRHVNERRFFHIPYWPQPGLIPRDPERGKRVESVAFKGMNINLHPYFQRKEWNDWLKEHNLKWDFDSVEFDTLSKSREKVNWNDYHNVDIVLAFRRYDRRNKSGIKYTSKPATKLYNAWHAGVPAILGPDYPHREIRKSELDYIEITSPEMAKDAVLYLKSNPEIYLAMIENGKKRAEEFTIEKITERWAELLFVTIPKQLNKKGIILSRNLPFSVRESIRFVNRKIAGRGRW